MDFFERLFGWAPDGGDGTLELMLLVAASVALLLGVTFRGRVLQRVLGAKH